MQLRRRVKKIHDWSNKLVIRELKISSLTKCSSRYSTQFTFALAARFPRRLWLNFLLCTLSSLSHCNVQGLRWPFEEGKKWCGCIKIHQRSRQKLSLRLWWMKLQAASVYKWLHKFSILHCCFRADSLKYVYLLCSFHYNKQKENGSTFISPTNATRQQQYTLSWEKLLQLNNMNIFISILLICYAYF